MRIIQLITAEFLALLGNWRIFYNIGLLIHFCGVVQKATCVLIQKYLHWFLFLVIQIVDLDRDIKLYKKKKRRINNNLQELS